MMHALLLAAALRTLPTPPALQPSHVDAAPPVTTAAELTEGPPDDEAQARAVFLKWKRNPKRFVRDVFRAKPDRWQDHALASAVDAPKLAMKACKGPGKSCVLAWLIWWFLAVHDHAQVMALSITADNLRDNLWKELALWYSKAPLLESEFEFNRKSITHRKHGNTWWVSARAFAKSADASQQANTLAGFHGANIMVVLDEIGDYPPGVLPAAEAIFATEGQNAHLVVAGNPTSVHGPLYTIVTRDAAEWVVIPITGDPDDPMRSPRIRLDWAKAEIKKLGRDNAWVMVNILGEFPPEGSDQLIGINVVTAAMARDVAARAYLSDARVWGLDPARFGDDEAVLARRQGVLGRRVNTWRNMDGTQLGDAVASLLLEADRANELPDAVFVDVGGVGSSAYDRLVFLGWGRIVRPVDFGGSASDRRYYNKRTEMWCLLADWLKNRPACLPSDEVLKAELVAPRYWFRTKGNRTCYDLESKAELKERGLDSPNRADAFALTFAAPVAPTSRTHRELEHGESTRCKTEYESYVQGARPHGKPRLRTPAEALCSSGRAGRIRVAPARAGAPAHAAADPQDRGSAACVSAVHRRSVSGRRHQDHPGRLTPASRDMSHGAVAAGWC